MPNLLNPRALKKIFAFISAKTWNGQSTSIKLAEILLVLLLLKEMSVSNEKARNVAIKYVLPTNLAG